MLYYNRIEVSKGIGEGEGGLYLGGKTLSAIC